MATPRFVCHRCRHKWKVKRGETVRECTKCGHANVGPTDPAPSYLGKFVVLLLVAVAGAWYFDLLPGSASDAIDEGLDAVESKLDETRRDMESLDDERPRRPPKPKTKTQEKTAPAETKAKAPVDESPAKRSGNAEHQQKPDVVVQSKSAAALSTSYMVKGKIKNKGGADATGIRVVVTFLGEGGVISAVEARCPAGLAAGKTARYEAALAGDDASRVEDFKVRVRFD